jgi:hypothetical protein
MKTRSNEVQSLTYTLPWTLVYTVVAVKHFCWRTRIIVLGFCTREDGLVSCVQALPLRQGPLGGSPLGHKLTKVLLALGLAATPHQRSLLRSVLGPDASGLLASGGEQSSVKC